MTPKPKPPKHSLRRTEIVPGKPDKHVAVCGFSVIGAWESRVVRSAITISGKVTCLKCLKETHAKAA